MKQSEIIKTINHYYPDYKIESLVSFGEGYDSEAYLVNQDCVFKFPRHEPAAENLFKEVAALQEIGDRLPIHTPEIRFVGKSSQSNLLEFVGYEKLDGKQMTSEMVEALDEEARDDLARKLAAFFKTLHNLKLNNPIEGLELSKKDKCQQEYQVIQDVAMAALSPEIREEAETVYQKILGSDFDYTKCLVHNDFGANNLFYDVETNQLTGMIDFGDIAIYDRDIDFVCLLQEEEDGLDRDFTRKVLEYYQYDNIDLLNQKRMFNHFYSQFENIYLGKVLEMEELLEESLSDLKNGIQGYEENIVDNQNYRYYI